MSLEASSLREGGDVTMLLFDYYCCIDIASDIDDVMICNLLVMHYCVMYYDVIISLPCCAKR